MLAEKIALILSLALVGSVLIRVVLLRTKGTSAFTFGKTDKSDFAIIPFMATLIYLLVAQTLHLPAPALLIHRLWGTAADPTTVTATAIIGLACCALAVAGLNLSLSSFGRSFRIGIDEQHPNKLITTGVFAYSRNPIYVCFGLFLIGLTLVFASPVIIVAHTAILLLMHRQVLREEVFLSQHYGADWTAYCGRTPRYFGPF
ncbi:MAG: isoprenylcysteine carboxylmethyltransferase family protein [Coriobacteriia bacterium]|nr:isoprenylcysteine carboxylmethyltransferase family protein [Coriobacteriia bacterium]